MHLNRAFVMAVSVAAVGLFAVGCGEDDVSTPESSSSTGALVPAPQGVTERLPESANVGAGQLALNLGIERWTTYPGEENQEIIGYDSRETAIVRFVVTPGRDGLGLVRLSAVKGVAIESPSPDLAKPYYDALSKDVLKGLDRGVHPGDTPSINKDGTIACCWSQAYVGYITLYGGGNCHIEYVASPCSGFWDCTTAAAYAGCTHWT